MPAVKECFDVTMASASLEILSVMIIIQKIVTTVQMKSIVEERLNLPEKVISLLNYNSAPNARLNQVPSNYILACQRDGVSNKPLGQRLDTGLGILWSVHRWITT